MSPYEHLPGKFLAYHSLFVSSSANQNDPIIVLRTAVYYAMAILDLITTGY